MNYLAHLFLSNNDPDLLAGNFIADFIRNKDLENLPVGIRKGVFLHRAIDQYTDNHPNVKNSVVRSRCGQGKYAPVAVDIFYDHILYKNWSAYTNKSFGVYTDWMYTMLQNKLLYFPDSARNTAEKMLAARWLDVYKTPEGLTETFRRLKLRTRFGNKLENATAELLDDYAHYEKDFHAFFPEAQSFVALQF